MRAMDDLTRVSESDLPPILHSLTPPRNTASLDLRTIQRRARQIEMRRRSMVGAAVALVCLSGAAGVSSIARALPATSRPATSAGQCSWPPPDIDDPKTDGQVPPSLGGLPPGDEAINAVQDYADKFPEESGTVLLSYNKPRGTVYVGFTGRECYHLEQLRGRVTGPDSVRIFTVQNSRASALRLYERIVKDKSVLSTDGVRISIVAVNPTSGAVDVGVRSDVESARDVLVQRYSADAPAHLLVYAGPVIYQR